MLASEQSVFDRVVNPPCLHVTLQELRNVVSSERATADLAESLAGMLRTYPHFVVLRGPTPIEDGALTVRLARAIANTAPLKAGLSREERARVSCFRVEIDVEQAGKKAGVGTTRHSSTNQPIALHTDFSFAAEPCELVAFQFVRADPHGGDTLLAAVEDVIGVLDDEMKETLKRPIFPFGEASHAVLWDKNGKPNIRYYRTQIETALEKNKSLTTRELAAMKALDEALRRDDVLFRFHAEAGETVFIHNTKVLHGRTGFTADSNRLMYRIRSSAGCLE